MKPCRECGKSVSAEAKACPHCGVQWPGDKMRAAGNKLLGIGCALTLLITLPFLLLLMFL
jgi:hypothetical protein